MSQLVDVSAGPVEYEDTVAPARCSCSCTGS